ncbi:phosphotransferase [Ensifer adhaerens]|uniref:phosphotransferase n=1 Tax=Ensifer adhaerens TaxID=106592 RepID=UPI00117853E8|nr:phosphotransferase [Ensifer adhaerens]
MTGKDGLADDTPLSGGGRTAVSRRGAVVLRETGPWAPSVHALLRHFEVAGFDGAPRVVGSGFDEAGREMLTYVEGDILAPAPWSDEAIAELGRLMREMHDAAASFQFPQEARWRPWFGRAVGTSDIVGHCDAAPWNIVSRDGLPVALIDWEAAGPVDRLTELAMVAWNNAQLYDDGVAAMNGLSDATSRIRQVRLFADGYGLAAADRHRLADRIILFAAESAANEAFELDIRPESELVPRVWGIAWQARSVAWLLRNRAMLAAVLS